MPRRRPSIAWRVIVRLPSSSIAADRPHSRRSGPPRWRIVLVALLLALGAPLIHAASPAARLARARPPLPLTVVQVSDSALTLDSNSPATSGPHVMYVSYRITNTAGASVANLSATIAGFGGGIGLSGGQSATQYVGTLGAGQSRTV